MEAEAAKPPSAVSMNSVYCMMRLGKGTARFGFEEEIQLRQHDGNSN